MCPRIREASPRPGEDRLMSLAPWSASSPGSVLFLCVSIFWILWRVVRVAVLGQVPSGNRVAHCQTNHC